MTKMQDETGGYCSKCNTVWASPGTCQCKPVEWTQLQKDIWNAAIEEAAKIIDQCNREGPYQAIAGARRIRELKK
jgi:hypothetical protein